MRVSRYGRFTASPAVRPACGWLVRSARRRFAPRSDVLQHQLHRDLQTEPAATALLYPHAASPLRKAPLQQHEARLEILCVLGQPDLGIEAQFPVRELGPSLLRMLARELPEDGARDALDQVVMVQEDAVIRLVVTND
ncbi:hypothetical protein ACLF3G_28725 [Falsiroseomonas sp. HC035]|uniref:hypothetical protein n=1 Tax=Falsiroseomonas sp. HC035 TaxID=3390999 RepID=UPI003D3205A2